MRRYSEAVKADVRRRMTPPHRQSVARISEELGIHVITLYKWRKTWRLQGEVVPASEKDPDGWSAADKFTVVLETAGLNATELSAYCRGAGSVSRAGEPLAAGSPRCQRQAGADDGRAEGAREAPRPGPARDQGSLAAGFSVAEGISKRRSKRSCSARKRPWRRWRHCWCCEKSGRPSARRTRKADQRSAPAEGDRADRRGQCRWRWPGERLQ
jgi:transposase-like protein